MRRSLKPTSHRVSEEGQRRIRGPLDQYQGGAETVTVFGLIIGAAALRHNLTLLTNYRLPLGVNLILARLM